MVYFCVCSIKQTNGLNTNARACAHTPTKEMMCEAVRLLLRQFQDSLKKSIPGLLQEMLYNINGAWRLFFLVIMSMLPWWLSSKQSACNAGDAGSITGSGKSPGEGKGNPLQYSCLENPMDKGALWATVHWVTRVGHD